MPTLIKNGAVAENPWVIVPRDEDVETALARAQNHLIVPAELWLGAKARFDESGRHIAVWLDSDQHPSLIEPYIQPLSLIALNFPKFSDGRAFSYAVMLRKHYGYRGELRAIGDVLRDPLFYMKRCGFDSFDLSDQVKLEDALRAFKDFQTTYAGTVEEPVPLFRRRAG